MFDGLLLPGLRPTSAARWELDPLASINRGLLRFIPHDEPGGSILRDISPARLHGTTVGAVNRRVAARLGRATNYPSTGNYGLIRSGKIVAGQPNWTIAAWVKLASGFSSFNGSPIYTERASSGLDIAGLYCTASGLGGDRAISAFFVIRNDANVLIQGCSGTTAIADGRWHLIVGTKAGTALSMYIDGKLENTATYAGADTYTDAGIEGRAGSDAQSPSDGAFGDYGPLRLYSRAIAAREVRDIYSDTWSGAIDPAARLFHAVRSISAGVSVSLTGIAITSAAGTVAPGIGVSASGSAATSAAGTPTSAIGSTLAGSAGTASAGTATSGIGMSLTGEALTVSAGSLAYTIGFTLTGSAATTAGGALTSSGGDVLTTRSLTGISMTALPGNVRVTGGTRWRPSEAQAVTPPSMVGNTLQPPPRLVGDPASDNRAIQQWLQTLYDHVIKRDNVLGRIADHETRIAAIEATDDTGST